ncbi:hypothetical protein A6U87_09450 [Rhizobium sp. AC44/96]|jgi:hypothetical protein|uniref:hypothetical protein n=1 Tax=Rhizobium sp. AC44/96 TaxID=1841654 RepID=UPI00080F7A57|nr:hypothetical protein [Rhizobium sp. AC44/96]OCJ09073.1 hypothetical protein A6U87_09450 [Rhizobium sp. AC44/96]
MPAPIEPIADLGLINSALKILCREAGIERDRREVLQVATLLMSLWKQGVRDQKTIVELARSTLAEAASLRRNA